MNDKIITALLAILIALGGWTLSRTFSLSQDMVLVKEKISQVEKAIDEQLWNTLPDTKQKKKKKKKKKKSVDNVAYYKIPVDFEITGNFLGYIKFKRQLSLSQKMLNFDKESIKVIKGKGDSTGAIKVNGTLTIVGLADDFF